MWSFIFKLLLSQSNMFVGLLIFVGWIPILLFWQVGADDSAVLDQIIDSLTSLANASENNRDQISGINRISLRIGKVQETATQKGPGTKGTSSVLIIGAGRVCRPAAELLASFGSPSHQMQKTCMETDFEWQNDIRVLVASLYLKDAEEVYLRKTLTLLHWWERKSFTCFLFVNFYLTFLSLKIRICICTKGYIKELHINEYWVHA